MRFGAIASDTAFLLLLDRADGVHHRNGFDLDTIRRVLDTLARVHGRAWGKRAWRAGLSDKNLQGGLAASLAADVAANWDLVMDRFPRHLGVRPDLSTLPERTTRLEPVTLTHNDLHAENILVSPDRVVFCDWQNASWSTPAYDVANILAGCARPDVQRAHWHDLLDHYASALEAAGGPPQPRLEADVATSTALLFAWMMRYLASISDEEAAQRRMLLSHWERVCTGVSNSQAQEM